MSKTELYQNATSAVMRDAQISPRKARLVADLIRWLPVDKAMHRLKFNNQKAARLMKKVLDSAIANAEHNAKVDIDLLVVREARVDKGHVLKRLSPRARGRADRILKRRSHITLTVVERKHRGRE